MVTKLISKVNYLDYLYIGIGSAIMALGIAVFLVDAKVVPGGISGLAMAIYYVSDNTIPIGITTWIFNIPLFIWGYKELGKKFGIRTFYGFTVNSFFIDFFRGDVPGFSWIRLQDSPAIRDLYQNDFLFMILVGAVLVGIGLGIVFKFRGTTAGVDIIVAIMQKRYGIKPGQSMMIIDFVIIALAGVIISYMNLSPDKPAITLSLYALFLLYISSKIVDIVIDGFDYARAAFIITDKYEEVSEAIMHDMNRGATAIKTRGIYRNLDREMIFTVVTLKELSELESMVKNIDPSAFIIITNVHEVLGKGFRRRF
ncbi:MAG TPA: YitT family protein [Candidatus Kapabacteria bacterium]|nr:YitT family protein [Candidatus Kapabacteria bacterium]